MGLAFSAGILAFLNPCSFALLPAYLSYFLGRETEEPKNTLSSILRGVKYGSVATLGFIVVFSGIGSVVSIFGSQIREFLPLVLLFISPVLVILGLLWVFDKGDLYLSQFSFELKSNSSFFLFGSAYAFSSLACVFPVFLMVVFSAMSTGGFGSGLLVFLSYTFGMGLMMVIISVAVALSKDVLIENVTKARKYVKKISGIVLLIAGFYLIYYWYVTF